ncbi:hypothetical protein MNEG_1702 [Monoraphidium neglectum]|uniref:Uncharacterized protein n=1 Tax=Monoraphidium neglectum TaxID=145388 RepID=A0A0D2N160_9CHLO|nr:hypothetical protein MNEG_1702 [Monoraphidium neglectum]KIZ06257.1 hypothetical protein MNEG_1702 [Monoraphidium neglectum]|eukprot:XP_013905276.1 hypothetical protein MNEG_1702 [Monoraphidium neglectum]
MDLLELLRQGGAALTQCPNAELLPLLQQAVYDESVGPRLFSDNAALAGLCCRLIHACKTITDATDVDQATENEMHFIRFAFGLTPRSVSSSLAIRILYKSKVLSVLEQSMETLWDVADQVGADSPGVENALGSMIQAVDDMSCYEFKLAPREDGRAPSQVPAALASQQPGGRSTGRVVLGPIMIPQLMLVLGLNESTTPYLLRRDATSCLLTLATSSKANQRVLLRHEAREGGPGGQPEGMAQRLWGRLLRSCGDYPMQRDLAELLYRCARNGRPDLHARFLGDPELAAAFDEVLEQDPKDIDLSAELHRFLGRYNEHYHDLTGVVSLEADSIELAMPFLAPEAGPEGRLLHLGRGHMTFAARRIEDGQGGGNGGEGGDDAPFDYCDINYGNIESLRQLAPTPGNDHGPLTFDLRLREAPALLAAQADDDTIYPRESYRVRLVLGWKAANKFKAELQEAGVAMLLPSVHGAATVTQGTNGSTRSWMKTSIATMGASRGQLPLKPTCAQAAAAAASKGPLNLQRSEFSPDLPLDRADGTRTGGGPAANGGGGAAQMAAAAGDGGGLGVMVQAGAWHGRSPLGTMVTPAEQVVPNYLAPSLPDATTGHPTAGAADHPKDADEGMRAPAAPAAPAAGGAAAPDLAAASPYDGAMPLQAALAPGQAAPGLADEDYLLADNDLEQLVNGHPVASLRAHTPLARPALSGPQLGACEEAGWEEEVTGAGAPAQAATAPAPAGAHGRGGLEGAEGQQKQGGHAAQHLEGVQGQAAAAPQARANGKGKAAKGGATAKTKGKARGAVGAADAAAGRAGRKKATAPQPPPARATRRGAKGAAAKAAEEGTQDQIEVTPPDAARQKAQPAAIAAAGGVRKRKATQPAEEDAAAVRGRDQAAPAPAGKEETPHGRGKRRQAGTPAAAAAAGAKQARAAGAGEEAEVDGAGLAFGGNLRPAAAEAVKGTAAAAAGRGKGGGKKQQQEQRAEQEDWVQPARAMPAWMAEGPPPAQPCGELSALSDDDDQREAGQPQPQPAPAPVPAAAAARTPRRAAPAGAGASPAATFGRGSRLGAGGRLAKMQASPTPTPGKAFAPPGAAAEAAAAARVAMEGAGGAEARAARGYKAAKASSAAAAGGSFSFAVHPSASQPAGGAAKRPGALAAVGSEPQEAGSPFLQLAQRPPDESAPEWDLPNGDGGAPAAAAPKAPKPRHAAKPAEAVAACSKQQQKQVSKQERARPASPYEFDMGGSDEEGEGGKARKPWQQRGRARQAEVEEPSSEEEESAREEADEDFRPRGAAAKGRGAKGRQPPASKKTAAMEEDKHEEGAAAKGRGSKGAAKPPKAPRGAGGKAAAKGGCKKAAAAATGAAEEEQPEQETGAAAAAAAGVTSGRAARASKTKALEALHRQQHQQQQLSLELRSNSQDLENLPPSAGGRSDGAAARAQVGVPGDSTAAEEEQAAAQDAGFGLEEGGAYDDGAGVTAAATEEEQQELGRPDGRDVPPLAKHGLSPLPANLTGAKGAGSPPHPLPQLHPPIKSLASLDTGPGAAAAAAAAAAAEQPVLKLGRLSAPKTAGGRRVTDATPTADDAAVLAPSTRRGAAPAPAAAAGPAAAAPRFALRQPTYAGGAWAAEGEVDEIEDTQTELAKAAAAAGAGASKRHLSGLPPRPAVPGSRPAPGALPALADQQGHAFEGEGAQADGAARKRQRLMAADDAAALAGSPDSEGAGGPPSPGSSAGTEGGDELAALLRGGRPPQRSAGLPQLPGMRPEATPLVATGDATITKKLAFTAAAGPKAHAGARLLPVLPMSARAAAGVPRGAGAAAKAGGGRGASGRGAAARGQGRGRTRGGLGPLGLTLGFGAEEEEEGRRAVPQGCGGAGAYGVVGDMSEDEDEEGGDSQQALSMLGQLLGSALGGGDSDADEDGGEVVALQQMLARAAGAKKAAARRQEAAVVQEVQAAMAAKASELGAALRAEEKQLAAAASGRLARAAAALEERATAMAALRDRFEAELRAMWDDYNDHYSEVETIKQELEAALTKRRAGAKRRIAALQAEGDALLADARSRIQRRRKRAGKLPQLAALLKQFV